MKALGYWDSHPRATFCHHASWLRVFQNAYGRQGRIFRVTRSDNNATSGLAVLFLFRKPLFGKVAVALPYLDYGGPLGDDEAAEAVLIQGLRETATRQGWEMELRSRDPLPLASVPSNTKVSMVLDLGKTNVDGWWKTLDAKVRNQVRKAEKVGVTLRAGKAELLDEFYRVFAENMRDLGSPVHSKRFLCEALTQVPDCELVNAYREGRCIGGLIRIRKGDTLAIPWASTLRSERIHCPNNALYDNAIRFAFTTGLKQVDFGRSTRDEGTYKFKKQWLAEERPLPWYPFDAKGNAKSVVAHVAASKLDLATSLWSKLPVGFSTLLGAKIRPHIPA